MLGAGVVVSLGAGNAESRQLEGAGKPPGGGFEMQNCYLSTYQAIQNSLMWPAPGCGCAIRWFTGHL